MPKQIQQPDAAVALEKEFSILGKLGLHLDEIVVPVANVANLTPDPTDAWGSGFSVGAVAAQFAFTMVQNPANSGVLIYVDELQVFTFITSTLAVILEDTLETPSNLAFYADRRVSKGTDGASPRPLVEIANGNDLAGISGNAIQQRVLGNSGSAFHQLLTFDRMILTPGTGLKAGITAVANTSLQGTWKGRVQPIPRTSA